MREGFPSVFDITNELDPRQRLNLEGQLKKAVSTEVGVGFSDYDFSPEDKELREAKEVFDEFLTEVFIKAAKREFLRPEERDVFVVNLEIAFRNLYKTVQEQDTERMQNLSPGQSSEDFDDELLKQVSELEVFLETGEISEKERQEAQRELERLKGIGKSRILQVATGRKQRGLLTQKELAGHRESTVRFLEKEKEIFNPGETAEKIVGEYNKLLVAHKISFAFEAKYSDNEIFEHLRGSLPEAEEANLVQAIKEGRKQARKNKPDEIGKFEMYTKIMSVLFRGKKIEAAGFVFGSMAVGALAPLMPRFLGQYLESGNTADIGKSAFFSLVSCLSQAELNLRLSGFMADRMFGQDMVVKEVVSSVLGVSLEGLSKTDVAILRQQTGRALERIQQTAETSIKDIGVDLSRVVGLGLSVAVRLGDPLLFVPIVIATAMSLAAAKSSGKEKWQAEKEMNQANDELIKSVDEMLKIKSTRGETPGIQEQILESCRKTRKTYSKAVANFQRAGGLPITVLLTMNALIANWRGTPQPEVAESLFYSTQLSTSLTNLIEKSARLSDSLQPVAELAGFCREFKDRGGAKPKNWEVELVDIKRRGLEIPSLKINPGDFCVTVGESGAGKTTLLEVLTGFGLDRGIMMVDGRRWSALDKKTYREGLMVANQYYALETKSLKDNIVGDGEFNRAIFEEGLKSFDLDKMLEKVSEKKLKEDGRRVSNPAEEFVVNKDFSPSGGERKRIAMLAIDYRLRTDPDSVKIILLDEPTAGMNNPAGSRRIFGRIAEWHRDFPDKTFVVSNHDARMFTDIPEDFRILGFDFKTGEMVQDEKLSTAKENHNAPFAQLFNE